VALVYDVMDTEGKPLPEDVASFFAHGPTDEKRILSFIPMMGKKKIESNFVDAGDRNAGLISVRSTILHNKTVRKYRMYINRNHLPAVNSGT
jgi:hypothetical protein